MPTNTGRKKYIETPEELWKLFTEFMEWVSENPYKVQDFVGKDGDEVFRVKPRPITFLGFKKWLALENVISDLRPYESNENGSYTEYLPTITRIKAICNAEIVEGAAAGVYNPMIASKVAGLVEKIEQKNIEQPLFGGE